MKKTSKRNVTFKIAGIFFAVSFVFEIANIAHETVILGMTLSGAAAVLGHLAYALLYGWIGFGLWFGTVWGAFAVYIGTAVYSMDKLTYIINRSSIESTMVKDLSYYRLDLQPAEIETLVSLTILTVLIMVVSWWGFAIYTYSQRAYFLSEDDIVDTVENR